MIPTMSADNTIDGSNSISIRRRTTSSSSSCRRRSVGTGTNLLRHCTATTAVAAIAILVMVVTSTTNSITTTLSLPTTLFAMAQTFTYEPTVSSAPSISRMPTTFIPSPSGTGVGTTLQPSDPIITMAPVTDAPSSDPPQTAIPEVTDAPTRNPITDAPSLSPVTAPTTPSPVSAFPTRRPSSPPTTRYPTRPPTRRPSPLPTEYPTSLEPTNNPSSRPITRLPTRIPTHTPSHRPTRIPTHRPSHRPTPLPTTESPSDYPTESPVTDVPTKLPTSRPTTRSPIRSPTSNPQTEHPSSRPSPVPTTERPATLKPTTARPSSYSPTNSPSAIYNATPTSGNPTIAPVTNDPTRKPTKLPTAEPSPSPSRSPVIGTASPTETPSSKPSITESETPTYSPAGDVKLIGPIQSTGLTVTLTGIGNIPNQLEWESTTSDFFVEMYDESSAVYDAKVEVMITDVTNPNGRRRRLNGGESWRRLQSDSSVQVTYTQSLWYSSLDPNFSMTTDEIAQLPLSTETNRDEYVGRLKSTLDGYESLTSVSEIAVSSNKEISGGDESGLPLPAIIGISVGSVALALILFIGFVYYKKKTKHGNDVDVDNNHHDDDPISTQTLSTQDMKTSLGGAGGTGSSVPTYGDQSVATVDYDYSRAFGGAGGDLSLVSDAGGTLGSRTGRTGAEEYPEAMTAVPGSSGNTIFSDDPTFDQAYEDLREEVLDIYAPAGKLGVVIDTPDDGAPVIHAVKDTSPIFNKVQVGDKLVAVDDEDVRSMTAIKVSKLISRKSNNASRKLTIIRHVTASTQ